MGEGSAVYSATLVARWFLAWAADVNDGDPDITPMKLQKLLYYAQGRYLAKTGFPLFPDTVRAFEHGPVVPSTRYAFSTGNVLLSAPSADEFQFESVKPEDTRFLIEVWNDYGHLNAAQLRRATHKEAPWADTHWDKIFNRDPEITIEAMRDFFTKQEDECRARRRVPRRGSRLRDPISAGEADQGVRSRQIIEEAGWDGDAVSRAIKADSAASSGC